MVAAEKSKQRGGSRFIKSYKYKHKRRISEINLQIAVISSCDMAVKRSTKMEALGAFSLVATFVLLMILQQLSLVVAFCPAKCLCDDQSLSANCTRLPSITTIPTTLNPLLKRLTLNQLPLAELASSLSVYRQLEQLNLQANQLRHISYENLNFKPAPPSVSLSTSVHHHAPQQQHHSALNTHQEQLARHLKQAIDKSMSLPADEAAETRFHLRSLDLGDNRIEKLGDLEPDLDLELMGDSLISGSRAAENQHQTARIRARDLERLAPFLTLTKLEFLNLSGNKLAKLHRHVFLGLLSLRELDLSRNQLEWLDRHALVGLIELKQLKLDHNRLGEPSDLSSLSLAFCRAPLNELRHLDLSEQYLFGDKHGGEQTMLPNQMFICTPKLRSLKLEALSLRHIQVNAFDNLQELEVLHLGRNKLEHVPSDALAHSNSQLAATLRHLDLSETLIEFVSAGSLAALLNLERLSMNSMARLVSFDLASFLLKPAAPAGGQMESSNGEIINHGLGAIPMLGDDYWQEELYQQPEESAQLAALNSPKLRELHLRNNVRLQSLRCSSSRPYHNRKCQFDQLNKLDLAGALELRELPLDRMLNLERPLQLDLSFVAHLNCSSCRLNWLFETMRGQSSAKIQLIGAPESVGCVWPLTLPLVQLLELDSTLAPLLSHCRRRPSPSSHRATDPNQQSQNTRQDYTTQVRGKSAEPMATATDASENQSFASSLALGLALLLAAVAAGARLALLLAARRRRPQLSEPSAAFQWAAGFKWRPVAASDASSSPASSQHNSGASQVFHHSAGATLVAQLEERPPPANLFSRLAGLFGRRAGAADWPPVAGKLQSHHHGLIGVGRQQTGRQHPSQHFQTEPTSGTKRFLGQVQHQHQQQQQQRQMSPAAGGAHLLPLGAGTDHIYVTLDRPIRSQYDELGPPAPRPQLATMSRRHFEPQASDCKSFEWTGSDQFKVVAAKVDDHGRQLAEQLGKLSLQIEAAEFGSDAGNVTGHSELRRTKNGQIGPFSLPEQREPSEYDANHAAAPNNDDDRVINGLPGQQLPADDNGAEPWAGRRHGSQRAAAAVANMIGQQLAANKRQQHHQPERACDYLAGQQRFCDIPAGARKPPRLVGGPPPAPVISEGEGARSGLGAPVTNGHEIYSNQFYYCRPSSSSNQASDK